MLIFLRGKKEIGSEDTPVFSLYHWSRSFPSVHLYVNENNLQIKYLSIGCYYIGYKIIFGWYKMNFQNTSISKM